MENGTIAQQLRRQSNIKILSIILTIVLMLIANLAATLMIIKEGTTLLTTLVDFITTNQPLFDSLTQVLDLLQPV